MRPDKTQSSNHRLMPFTNEVLITEPILNEEEQASLVAWAELQYQAGRLNENPQDPGAFSTPFCSTDGQLSRLTRQKDPGTSGQKLVWVPSPAEQAVQLPAVFWEIRERVVDLLGLGSLQEDHYKGAFLSYIKPGSRVHQHRDDRIDIGSKKFLILRCNVLFKKPLRGGLPAIGSNQIDVPERGMWAFFPTELVHSATEVEGAEFRGLLSFGFLLAPEEVWQQSYRLSQDFEAEYGLTNSDSSRLDLIEKLANSAEATGIEPLRIQVLRHLILAQGQFSIVELGQSLGCECSAVAKILRDLQKSKIIISESCAQNAPGSILVF